MPLSVTLGGYNVDVQVLDKRLTGASEADGGALSPETISAAYARISRDPRHVSELRSLACREVERARASNRAIIFDMGHASVSEHAVFNLDISGVSRLAVEALEHHRLASYTEKSQRYVRLQGDIVVPAEIKEMDLEQKFRDLVTELASAYQTMADKLTDQARVEAPAHAKRRDIESRAHEDARYLLPLCTETQLGMTVNARTLELMIARLKSHQLAEARDLGQKLREVTFAVAPSLIRYTGPTNYFRDTPGLLKSHAKDIISGQSAAGEDRQVVLQDHTPDPDSTIASALLYPYMQRSLAECREHLRAQGQEDLRYIFGIVYKSMELWDALPRAFETVSFTFELIVSATAFAQLKRHRMATLLTQDYDPDLGRTVPEAITRAGLAELFHAKLDNVEKMYRELREQAPEVAPYVLTNTHRRRVLMRLNARDLGHLSRLRCDHEAQWDIRDLASEMVVQAQKVMPLAGIFYGGKDCVGELKRTIADW